MTSTEKAILIQNRSQDLRIWLIKNNKTLKDLAKTVGVTSSTLYAHLNSETIPVRHHKKLVKKHNIPLELLPEPKDIPMGRRPQCLKNY